MVKRIDEQARQIPYVPSAERALVREELANRLADIAPGGLPHTFLSVSGSKANEVAVQFVREYQDTPTVLTRWRSQRTRSSCGRTPRIYHPSRHSGVMNSNTR